MQQKLLALLLTAALTGCAAPIPSAQKDIASTAKVPETWMFAPKQYAQQTGSEWWRAFNSPELSRLITEGLANNQNLAAAAINWQKARLAADSAAINQTPTANGSAGASASRNFAQNANSTSFSTGLSVSYQLDLWQKLAAQTQSAVWSANASAEDLLAAQLSLEGDIANAYFQLLYANGQLALNAQQIRYQTQTYNLINARYQAGSASRLDLTNAKQSLTALQTTKQSLEASAKQAQTALTTLLGAPPSAYIANASLQDITLPGVPAGLPAEILARRPDLRAAQYRLQADLGQTAAAERDFYPDISLTGSLNTGGSILADILKNPAGTLASSIALPFLQHREKNLTLKTSELTYQADLAAFRHSLYNAFKDVENALVSLDEAERNTAILQQQLKDADTVVNLTKIQYDNGAATLQTLLDAQQNRRSLQTSLLENRCQRAIRRVTLYLALGGSAQPAAIRGQLITPIP